MLSLSHLLPYFDLVLTNEDVAKSKPDPEIYTLAMKRLEVLPEETIIFEDSPHGVMAAKKSKAKVVTTTYGQVTIDLARKQALQIAQPK
jgi:HAD superfamily hydrolase (TIGR01509 family)